MKKSIYSILMSCFIAASCSNEQTIDNDSQMRIQSCYVMSSNNSQSENFSSPIGLYIQDEGGHPYDKGSYYASLSSGSWVLNEPVYVTKKGYVYSYYPYQEGVSLPEVSVDMNGQTDWLYTETPYEINNGSASLSIKLHHALALLNVSVENEVVAHLSLESPRTAKLNVCTGLFTEQVSGEVSASSDKLLVIPHTVSNKELKIRLSSGKEYSYTLDSTLLEQGKSYTFQFKLNEDREQLEVVSFSVEKWESGDVFNDYL